MKGAATWTFIRHDKKHGEIIYQIQVELPFQINCNTNHCDTNSFADPEGGDAAGARHPSSQRDPIFSVLHKFLPKSTRVGGWRPPTGNPGSTTGHYLLSQFSSPNRINNILQLNNDNV